MSYESNFVCPTKVLALIEASLSRKPFKTCANPQAHNQKLSRANRYENEMFKRIAMYHSNQGAREGGRTLRKGVSLPSKRLLSTFYNTPPSKNPSKNLCLYWNPYKAPSKNPSKKHLLLENLLRTLLRSVRLHDPLGVRPILTKIFTDRLKNSGAFFGM